MTKWLARLFHLGFAAVCFWVLWHAVILWQYNGAAAFVAALVLGGVLLFLLRAFSPRIDALGKMQFRVLFGCAAAGYLSLLCIFGILLRQVLIMDMAEVYASLPDFLDGLPLAGNVAGYYMVCNNNLGLALLLAAFYKICPFAPGTPAGLACGVLFNCFMIFLAVLLLCRAARLAGGGNTVVLLVLCCCAAFAPLYLYAPQFYSDTMVMPFLALAMVLFLRFRARPRHWLAYSAALGAAAFAAYCIKGSAVVLLPAAAIVMLLDGCDTLRRAFCAAAVMVLSFAVLLFAFQSWQNTFLDWNSSDSYRYPTELWFCYGSHDDGDYSQKDVDDANALPTVAARREMLRARILENYSSRSPGQNLDFFTHKAVLTWGDGKYNADEFTAAPVNANWTAHFTLPGQVLYMPLTYYCQVWQYLLLLLLGLGGLLALRPGQNPAGGAMFARLCLLGAGIFLSFWETKARYALHFAPFMIFCAVLALAALQGALFARRRTAAERSQEQTTEEFDPAGV